MQPASRIRLPRERQSVTHHFRVGEVTGYLTVGLDEDGDPREIFLVVGKQGELVRGLSHVLALTVSVALQHGVPLEKLAGKLQGECFEPAGLTGNPEIPMASSISDYVGRYLLGKFVSASQPVNQPTH